MRSVLRSVDPPEIPPPDAAVLRATADALIDELASTIDKLHTQVDHVPLGFVEWPVLASRVKYFSDEIRELVMSVPDEICGDVDLLEIALDLRLLARRLQDRSLHR